MKTELLSIAARLSDNDLLAQVKHLARHEREATASLVAHLAELDARKLFLGEGCAPPTMLQMAPTGALRKRGLSDSEDHLHLIFIHFDALHKASDYFTPGHPVHSRKSFVYPCGEFPQHPDHESELVAL